MKSLMSSYLDKSGILLCNNFLVDLLTPAGTPLMELMKEILFGKMNSVHTNVGIE